ncbi:MAG: hypothetical protein IH892_17345 [Planctomycetes bacterium]|nr:hypothetical protein [Planctomycetota bacterium]
MDYEYDVLFEGESIDGQDQATMPSEYAIYTKAHTFSEKSEALYILIQSTALKSPQTETEPFQVSSRTTEFNRDKSGKVVIEDGDRRARKAAVEKPSVPE